MDIDLDLRQIISFFIIDNDKKLKIKQNNRIFTILLAVFFIAAGFLLFGANKASAVDCYGVFNGEFGETKQVTNEADCKALADENKDTGYYYDGKFTSLLSKDQLKTKAEAEAKVNKESGDDASCGVTGWAGHPINCLLIVLLKILGVLLNWALGLFSFMADAERFSAVLGNDALYAAWGMVRDICNLGFILILLFSAFATVFQYSKYNYKNILLWLVIMALLVNFSYPFTLFIIDVSNSFMYTILLNHFASPKDILFTPGGGMDGIQTYIKSLGPASDTASMFFLVIFIFILALTIIALGLILLIRLIALAIILILSPIGFAGTVINKDGGWWNSLFKYAMAGPIIALVLYLSTVLMTANLAMPGATTLVGNNPVSDAMIKFTIPIVILWMGIAMAVKGIDGAGNILNKTRSYGINKVKGFSKGAWNSTGIPGGTKKAFNKWGKEGGPGFLKNVPGFRGSDKTAAAEDKIAGFLAGVSNKEKIAKNKTSIENESKNHEETDARVLHQQIKADAANSNKTHEEKITAAARVKAAMGLGKEYEKEIEEEATGEFLTNNPEKREYTNLELENHHLVDAIPHNLRNLPDNATNAQIEARREAIRKREKQMSDLKEARKKEIADDEKRRKKAVEEAKASAFKQNRKTVQEAEKSTTS